MMFHGIRMALFGLLFIALPLQVLATGGLPNCRSMQMPLSHSTGTSAAVGSDAAELARQYAPISVSVPGNAMGFAGIADARARADLIAYLEAVFAGRVAPPDVGPEDLKQAPAPSRVTAIGHCGDAYRVSIGAGKTRTVWEFDLRFDTEGSAVGPATGHPVIVGNGMPGDRAALVFSRLEEIATFIKKQCP
jgi:hypothetical protein